MGDNPTRIEGPRSQLVRLSTGRTVELRVVPSFRAMQREGLIDKRGKADLLDFFAGGLKPVLLSEALEEALLRHLLLDPPLSGLELGFLDDLELREILNIATRAYLEQAASLGPVVVVEDDDDPDEVTTPLEEPPAASLETAEDLLPPPGALPESKAPEVE